MASFSIKGRVDKELWESLTLPGESATEQLQRMVNHFVATQGQALETIAPTPAAAVAVLMQSHSLINRAQVVLSAPSEHAPPPPQADTVTATEAFNPAAEADDW
ncbi:MAG: hypothetical protein AAGJ80_00060 [Cyanobacteria bacterium J06553_1]